METLPWYDCAAEASGRLRIGMIAMEGAQRALTGITFATWTGGAADAARLALDDLRHGVANVLAELEDAHQALQIQAFAIEAADPYGVLSFDPRIVEALR